MKRTYSELIRFSSFEERLKYLMLHGRVGEDTFGVDRYLNQDFYRSFEWRNFRDRIITRDHGCDMALPDFPIEDWSLTGGKQIRSKILVHHLNPITKDSILQHSNSLLDPENAVCVSFKTHNLIHYGFSDKRKNQLPDFSERTPYDTSPWRKGAANG